MSRKIKRQTKVFLLTQYGRTIKIKAKDLTHHFSCVWIGTPLSLSIGEEHIGTYWKIKRIK